MLATKCLPLCAGFGPCGRFSILHPVPIFGQRSCRPPGKSNSTWIKSARAARTCIESRPCSASSAILRRKSFSAASRQNSGGLQPAIGSSCWAPSLPESVARGCGGWVRVSLQHKTSRSVSAARRWGIGMRFVPSAGLPCSSIASAGKRPTGSASGSGHPAQDDD